MNKFFARVLMLVAAVMLVSSASSYAQQQMPPIPVDDQVRIGQLPNGLTYYIRHNENPKGQADFYIAQKVGSILEEENQRGLAHFLEHMCFNGTTNFPGNQLRDWLESIGVKFGYNLNAYTSVDETVYNISNVPIERESVQDSCLLILHDWANDLTLDPVEIDKERGVIHEEWRRSMVGQMRILENLLPTMYPNSRYGYRLPIGTMEVVDNFPPQALRDYYEAWYRPDQQGVVVVGDIDVDRIEAKIKEMFADIEMPENAKPREYFPVEDTPGTIYAIGKDTEQSNAIGQLMYKYDATPREGKTTLDYLVEQYVMRMIVTMLDNRLNEISQNPDAPFAVAGVSDGEYFLAKTKNAFSLLAIAKGNDIRPAMEGAYRELLRAMRGGFTVSEYERARNEYLSQLEKAFNNRDNRESSKYVTEYVRHFIDNEPIPGLENEYKIMNMLAPAIPLEAINQVLPNLLGSDNRVFLGLLPDKAEFYFPTEEDMKEVFAAVDAETIEPYVDAMKEEPLIPVLPAPGKIVSETTDSRFGATEWTLSNGVKVIVKPTTFKSDEILFEAIAKGGYADFSDDYASSMIFWPYALSSAGLGEYNNIDMQKYLSGKQVSVSPEFGNYERSIEGNTTIKDLPTAMELLYMNFVDLNITAEDFAAVQKQYSGLLQNQESSPTYIFGKDVMEATFKSPRRRPISTEAIDKASREQINELSHKMTANASDYTFVFVGSIDLDTFRPLVEQYIATLPVDAAASLTDTKINPELTPVTGKLDSEFTTTMATPQTWTSIMVSANIPYTDKSRRVSYIAGQILGNRLLDKVREEMGATYSIGAQASVSRTNSGMNTQIVSQFPMKPEMRKEVLDYIAGEFQAMTTTVKEEEVATQVEFLVKNAKDNLEKNDAWLGAITGYTVSGVDTWNGDIELLKSITKEDVQNFVKQVLEQGNYHVVTLDPTAE
ncbi:MAG: insulinase family protein [Muribaculaceae bacterium]|nr:insulinase family protein [Muribaculaceae bacterium]